MRMAPQACTFVALVLVSLHSDRVVSKEVMVVVMMLMVALTVTLVRIAVIFKHLGLIHHSQHFLVLSLLTLTTAL